jgi:5,10-methylenetetrahydromethanopterin reductase
MNGPDSVRSVRSGLPSVSVALPPSRRVVEYARVAHQLGYERVWVFDSPALYGDIWISLARIAEGVPDIGLATGVAVSSLRHPMVTASAIATIEDLSPGRLWAYFGTGFTARLSMGKRGVRWADLATYVRQVRALLRGDVVDVDGAPCQMMHSPGWAPSRPIDVPLGLAPIGPKGFAISREVADGVILTAPPAEEHRHWEHAALLVNGSVLESGEDTTRRASATQSVRLTSPASMHSRNGRRSSCAICPAGTTGCDDSRRSGAARNATSRSTRDTS